MTATELANILRDNIAATTVPGGYELNVTIDETDDEAVVTFAASHDEDSELEPFAYEHPDLWDGIVTTDLNATTGTDNNGGRVSDFAIWTFDKAAAA